MSQYCAHCDHHDYDNIALPGNKGKNALGSLHGQYSSQILVYDFQKAKVVYD